MAEECWAEAARAVMYAERVGELWAEIDREVWFGREAGPSFGRRFMANQRLLERVAGRDRYFAKALEEAEAEEAAKRAEVVRAPYVAGEECAANEGILGAPGDSQSSGASRVAAASVNEEAVLQRAENTISAAELLRRLERGAPS